MKFPKLFFKKLLIGILLIAGCAGASLALKDFVDSLNPEVTLPILEVRCAFTTPIVNGDGSAERSLFRANYSWMFITGIKEGKGMELQGLSLYPTTLPPNVPLLFQFSTEPEKVTIDRADGLYGPDFVNIMGDVSSPQQPGVYCYRIQADFERGSILYYLAVRVDDIA
ncbi:MAG: hypothetical protein RR902_07285 [Oscillospiraceae bacterium]